MTEKKSYPEELYEWRRQRYAGFERSKLPNAEAAETARRVNARVEETTSGLRYPEDFLSVGEAVGGERVPSNLFDMKFEYNAVTDSLQAMGSGGVVSIDHRHCMVEVGRTFLDYAKQASCGECTFCRVGTTRMLEILDRIRAGSGQEGDVDTLWELARQVSETSLCEVGKLSSAPVLATLQHYGKDYEAHVRDGVCRAGTCPLDGRTQGEGDAS